MAMSMVEAVWSRMPVTAVLVLADGTVFEGLGLGATGEVVAEVCFNTAITGYQEILTDPSYLGQLVTFTFPHIGNVGANMEDLEALEASTHVGASGVVLASPITEPSNWRSRQSLSHWLAARGLIGIAGLDTRALTNFIRDNGMPHAVLAHHPSGIFDLQALQAKARAWAGLEGLDLVPDVTSDQNADWREGVWQLGHGYGQLEQVKRHVVAIDFGCKRNILRLLADAGNRVTVVPATTPAEAILALKPDGVFLSNGPGDPAATGIYAVPTIRALLQQDIPVFGICLGHQMLALALGAQTVKMHQGHHGANHPVKDLTTGKVEIVSMNHGFAVDRDTLPDGVVETHVSLFDGTNCGLALQDKPVFSVQHHPEASPGPRDSTYLFQRFANLMDSRRSSV